MSKNFRNKTFSINKVFLCFIITLKFKKDKPKESIANNV